MVVNDVLKEHTFQGHDSPLYALEKGTGDILFYAGGGDRVVSSWDTDGNSPQAIVHTASTIYSLKLIEGSNILLVGLSSGGMHVTDLANKKELRYLLLHSAGIFDIQFSDKQKI